MSRAIFTKHAMGRTLGLAAITMVATPTFAVELAAVPAQWVAPDGLTAVGMWGYISVPDAATFDCGTVDPTAPWGPPPTISASAGDTLTINLTNCLAEPVSAFIPGQYKPLAPVTADTDGSGRMRVTSFDAETAPGTVGTYTWANLKQGTYLYHSGTHLQVQVQMGLYGALVVGSSLGAGCAYSVDGVSCDVAYGQEQVLLYSEIDPVLHAAVEDGTYGTAGGPTSTFDYHPQYFLVNGNAYPSTDPVAVNTSSPVLLRFVNAGLKTHSPALGGGLYMTLYAEDGNLYPFTVEQYGLELPAAKTIDAILNVGSSGTYALYDRGLSVMNGAATGGGMLTYLQATAATGAPTAVADNYSVSEDGTLTAIVGDATTPGVLGNDTAGTGPGPMTASLVSDVSTGTLALSPDGSFTYTPNANFNGGDQFTYVANDGGSDSNAAIVSIAVTPVNDSPTAVADVYDAVEGVMLSVAAPGVLGNDSDIDGDTLTVSTTPVVAPINGTLTLSADGSFEYTPSVSAPDSDSFTYEACDAEPLCATAVVTINIVGPPPNQAPVAVDDDVSTPKSTVTPINVIANDFDPDGTIDSTTVDVDPSTPGVFEASVTTQRGGTAVDSGGGIVTYSPPNAGFRGTDTFTYTVNDNNGATSNVATVRVNVTK